MLNTPEESVRNFIELQYKEGNSKNIQVLCEYSKILEIFARIKSQWTIVGENEPYASVLSDEKYIADNIKKILMNLTLLAKRGCQ